MFKKRFVKHLEQQETSMQNGLEKNKEICSVSGQACLVSSSTRKVSSEQWKRSANSRGGSCDKSKVGESDVSAKVSKKEKLQKEADKLRERKKSSHNQRANTP